jgi:hydroxymethylpyrimidine pyrophosphatase-like HAD family hydrolase
MRPLSQLDAVTARGLRGLLFDLDDTVLSHGTLTREAYGALWDLRDAGLRLVAVTGRPSGWGEVLVRQWPIDGAVTENGAVRIVREARAGTGGGIAVLERCGEAERRSRRVRLAQIVERVREVVPEARLADDVSARRSDVTWDIGERVRLPADRTALIAQQIALAGARSTQSSVHIHATFDGDDKASGSIDLLSSLFGEDAGAARCRYAFVGDSGNDAACFAAFDTTFGVANVSAHLARIAVVPRYVASLPMGTGFAEIARALLAARR